MSCLPDIFITSKSQNLMPNKVGGQFSIHLRSAHFSNKPVNNIKDSSSFQSADAKRYRSWMDSQQAFKKTRRSSKSYFHRQGKPRERVIEERGFSHQNINARQRQQSEVEAISNFNILKRSAMENAHLSQKVLDQTNNQMHMMRQQIAGYRQNFQQDMQQYQSQFMQSVAVLSKVFKEQRRSMISEGKALLLQLDSLGEETSTSAFILRQMDQTLTTLIQQFL